MSVNQGQRYAMPSTGTPSGAAVSKAVLPPKPIVWFRNSASALAISSFPSAPRGTLMLPTAVHIRRDFGDAHLVRTRRESNARGHRGQDNTRNDDDSGDMHRALQDDFGTSRSHRRLTMRLSDAGLRR